MKSKSEPDHVIVAVQPHKDSVRETVESIVVAFILAFLFRTFEAEAFVIPTGSMAPTLMGQHEDVYCPECGYRYQVGEPETPSRGPSWGTCPNCRFRCKLKVIEETRDRRGLVEVEGDLDYIAPSYKGDRIIVSKFPYEFNDPRRWDVAVFKYPATAKTNFIKRIVGLPRETLHIFHGDVLTRPDGATDFRTARKPPDKVLAMLQPVYDNDYCQPQLIALGLPPRWSSATNGQGAWRPTDDGKSFEYTGADAREAWLRYEHRIPDARDWEAIVADPRSAQTRAQLERIAPQLIVDFCAYDTGRDDYRGLFWVGDLAVECELDVRSVAKSGATAGEVSLELVEGGRAFRCRIELDTGIATLSADDLPEFHPRGRTDVRPGTRHRLRLANVDNQLLLWVDDRTVQFDSSTEYELPWHSYTDRDYAPAGIAVRGASARVSHLRLLRDVYYTAAQNFGGKNTTDDQFLPEGSATPIEFVLRDGQFLMLGDNSPKSKDSRLWNRTDAQGRPEYYVSRDLLIGKAMFVYWPHAWAPEWAIPLRLGGMTLYLPSYPDFQRMRFIR
ncbi:MAG TPA: S26 family signal peptidase [Pirellulales bacterium]|jgi:signal peptidase I|nr:S26 family signal peptidase [Pirellulales bacterium]